MADYLDLDSDNDGIPDNIEAQTSVGYVGPNGDAGPANNGVDSAYTGGISPTNTDGTDTPDYIDLDSDNEGGNDTSEAGITLAGSDTDGDGLDDATDAITGYGDSNGIYDETQINNFPDADNDVTVGGDLDWRDAIINSPFIDTDSDGIPDVTDIDDDNDGVLDDTECPRTSYAILWGQIGLTDAGIRAVGGQTIADLGIVT